MKGIKGESEAIKGQGFLSRIKGFSQRLFYIIRLVWEASPLILIGMSALCILDGVLPVFGAYITRDLLNGISDIIKGGALAGSDLDNIITVMSPIIFIFVLDMIYLFLKRVMTRLNTFVTAIAGELVVNHIRLKILGKTKEIDQSSYDIPEFYEKLENANREAGMRPIHILAATFKVISGVISVSSFIVVLATLTPIAPIVIILASVPGAIVNYYFRNSNYLWS